ncbi:MAG: S8 family peptidase [Lachnospirales bacterium]
MDIIIKNSSKIPPDKIKYRLDIIDSVVVDEKYNDEYEIITNQLVKTQLNRVRKIVHCNTDYTGEGVGICFLDTGICKIEDFGNRIKFFKDFINNKNFAYDDNGHGTHVAGIACGGGYYKGIAPKANIIMLKTLDNEGSGNGSDVLAGIQWVYDNHKKYNIRILNMSIGTRESGKGDPLVMAVEKLWDKGITVVTAAGNNGPMPYTISSPGTSKKVITVGSNDDSENITLKNNYSSRGPTRECIIKPDVLAPGSNIISCKCDKGKYRALSGTSMSTPVVSGAIALLIEKYKDLSPDDIKYMLKLSSDSIHEEPNRQGWGLINIEKLLNMEAVYVRK